MIFETIRRLLATILGCDEACLQPSTALSVLPELTPDDLKALLTSLEEEFPVHLSDLPADSTLADLSLRIRDLL